MQRAQVEHLIADRHAAAKAARCCRAAPEGGERQVLHREVASPGALAESTQLRSTGSCVALSALIGARAAGGRRAPAPARPAPPP